MAKVEITKEQTVCDRCGARVTERGFVAQFVEGALKMLSAFTGGVSFKADLCKSCGESLVKWWNRKAGDE